MKATVDRKALVAGLRAVVPAATKGQGIAVLSGVRIDVASTGVDLTCSNLDLTVATTIDAPHSDKGSAVVPAGLLLRIVSVMAGDSVVIESDGDRLTVTSGEAVATLRCLDVDAWPKLAEPEGEAVELDATTVELLARILPMASVDVNRPILCGVLFADGRAAATDSYRLGVVDGIPDELGPALVPATALRAALADRAGVQATVGERLASFASGPTTWTVRLIDGDFPAYDRLLPSTVPYTLCFDRDSVADAVDRVSAIGSEAQIVRLQPDGGKLLLSMTDTDVGDVCDVVTVAGDFADIVAFNAAYLGDALDALEPGEVTVGLTDNVKPAVIRHGRLTLLLMPVRVGGSS